MPAPARIQPLERDIERLIGQDLSPAAQSRVLAEFAREVLAETEATNEHALGHAVMYETFVDGRVGASEDSVRPDGTIVYQFDVIEEVFAYIDEQLRQHSPVGSGADKHAGLYKRSHIFYADDVEADPLAPPPGIKIGTFVNTAPYARKIEAGESPQQPDGVYEVVTALAARRFGNIAKVQFGYRDAGFRGVRTLRLNDNKGGTKRVARGKATGRNPAIIVTLR